MAELASSSMTKTLPRLLAPALLIAALAFAGAGHTQTAESEVSSVMSQYLRLWNAHDAKTIVAKIYRLEPTHAWSTEAGLKGEFDRLKSQGYSHSDIFGVSTCMTGPDTAQTELRFSRLKTDGTLMPPRDRVSVYRLRKFPDGWRVIGMGGAPASGMVCK